MKLTLPPVLGVDEKHRPGSVRQVLDEGRELTGRFIKLTTDEGNWLQFLSDAGGPEVRLYKKAPKSDDLPPEVFALLSAKFPAEVADQIDARAARWLQHPFLTATKSLDVATRAQRALDSWRGAFHYADEDSVASGAIALRRPQLGALHAIRAHWSVTDGVATVVMPTGTGKTETMLATTVSSQCRRVLVLVPTDALRSQVADKFLTLGVLKREGSVILDAA
jgi:hypothetical protein